MLVGYMPNSVQSRIAQVHVGRSHVNFGAHNMLTISKFTCAHASEQVEIFLYRPTTMWAVFARLSQSATILANFLSTKAIDISGTVLDQLFRIRIQLVEIIRRMR